MEKENLNLKIKINKENDFKTKSSSRNIGIDLLKLIAMINIINLHVNLFTHYLKFNQNNPKYKQVYRLETFSYWPVDAFGLISGIVGYKKYKFVNVIYIWFIYCFYSVFFTLYLSYKSVYLFRYIISSFFPLGLKRNWYVNAYIFMYSFLPFVNESISLLNKRLYNKIVLLFFFIYSIHYIINMYINNISDYNFILSGYSVLWLLILYISGGYIGRFYLNKLLISNVIFILIYVISSFLTSEFIINNFFKGNLSRKLFLQYNSPTIIVQALSLIFFFSNLKIKNKYIIKVILFFNPLNLSVTIIHSRIFRSNIPQIRRLFSYIKSFTPKYLFFKIYGISILIYFICAFIDYFRHLLFKILKIRNLSNFIEKLII